MDNAYRILFETSGGTLVTGLSAGAVITAPVKDYCIFDGWYTDEGCAHAWSFADGIAGDLTLYAKWTTAKVHWRQP